MKLNWDTVYKKYSFDYAFVSLFGGIKIEIVRFYKIIHLKDKDIYFHKRAYFSCMLTV